MKALWKIAGFLVLTIFIVFFLAIVGGFFFLKSFDIKQYKGKIAASATEALGRNVDFGDIELEASFDKGVHLHVSDLTIAEAAEFGEGHFVSVKDIDARVDILSFILTRQVSVSGIIVNTPQIKLIRNAQGSLNIQSIGQKNEAASGKSSAAAAFPAVFINSLKIENAQIHLTDQSVSPELVLSVNDLTVGLEHFSLTNPFDVFLEASVLTPQKNLRWEGKAQLNLAAKEIRLMDTGILLELGQLPLETLRSSAYFKNIALPQLIDGHLKFKIKEAQINDQGLKKLVTDISLNDAKIIAPDLVEGISLEAKQVDFNAQNLSFGAEGLSVSRATLKAAVYQDTLNVDFASQVAFDPKTGSLRLSDGQFLTDLSLWPAKKIKAQIALLKDLTLPENLSGKLQVTIKDVSFLPSGLQDILLDAKLDAGAGTLSDIISFNQADLTVSNFSLGKQFSVLLKTAYLSDVQNVSFEGIVVLDAAAQDVAVKNGIATIDLNNFPFAKLRAAGLIPETVPEPKTLGGRLLLQVHDLNASAKGLGMLDVTAKLQSGKIAIDDVTAGVSLALNQINLEVKNFALDKPFHLSGSLAYEGDDPNVFIDADVNFEPSTPKLDLKNSTVKVDLAKLSIEEIKAHILSLKDVSLPESLTGELQVNIKELALGSSGIGTLESDVVLKNWQAKLKELSLPISGEETKFSIADNRLTADDLRFALGQGQIAAKVDVEDFLGAQTFSFSADIKDLDLAQILEQSASSFKVEGLVFANVKAQGAGSDLQSVSGEGNFEVKEAKLKDLNVLKTVLEKIAFIPDLAARVEAKLPEEYKAKLQNADTLINIVSSSIAISGGQMKLTPINVEADEFIFSGEAAAGFDQTYSLDGSFKITSDLSQIMGDSTEELKYLYDTNNLISLPVHISGQGAQMPVISVTQTALEMGKNAVRQEGKKQLGKVLGKVLEDAGVKTGPVEGEGEEAPQQADPATEIIGGILDKVFK